MSSSFPLFFEVEAGQGVEGGEGGGECQRIGYCEVRLVWGESKVEAGVASE